MRHRGLRMMTGLLALLALVGRAHALPVELKDENGTKYNINTDVDPLITNSLASGAITDATFVKPVTVTSYYLGLTPFGFWLTTYTVQRQINVPLTNAFMGFNGLTITAAKGAALPSAVVYNPGEAPVGDDCPQNNKNRELIFATQSFPDLGIEVSRRVFVNVNSDVVRWLNIVTNTTDQPNQVGITLQGLLGSENQTKVVATSDGNNYVTAGDLWFTTAQVVPQGETSLEPRVGFAVQGAGAQVSASSLGINSVGQAIATFAPTIQPGQSAIIMTFATVEGNNKNAKSAMENVVKLPSSALYCISTQDLAQVVNYPKITQPTLKNATVTLKFNKTGQDTIAWKGKLNVGAGQSLAGLPVTVDVGGVTQSFTLNKQGKANNGNGNKFALNATIKKGVTKAGDATFSFNLKGDFQTILAAYGLTDAAASNATVTLPITFTAGAGQFATDQSFTWNATAGKKGTAKAS